jgi:hypothetical protein
LGPRDYGGDLRCQKSGEDETKYGMFHVTILPMLNVGAVYVPVEFALNGQVAQAAQIIPREMLLPPFKRSPVRSS